MSPSSARDTIGELRLIIPVLLKRQTYRRIQAISGMTSGHIVITLSVSNCLCILLYITHP